MARKLLWAYLALAPSTFVVDFSFHPGDVALFVLAEVDERIGLERLRALHVNDSKAPLGSNRDRHDNIGEGLLGEELGVFLAHPKLQKLPAFLEVPGSDGHGPDAEQVRRLKALHARATTKRRGGSARRQGKSAPRRGVRRTRG